MAAQTARYQLPSSLMGTVAAYEARRKSVSNSPGRKDSGSSDHDMSLDTAPPPADAIYQRALPSLHFLRWRPLYHLQAPMGWMNDPCAPGYDSATGLYHLFFQWNPKRNVHGAIAWGNISWGHATSTDMINWTVSSSAVLKPGAWYDREGCFTGCMVPTGIAGQLGEITIFYTGVSRLPLHYTLPYKPSTETLVIVQSKKSRNFFAKMPGNPIIPRPPDELSVTGWRDPYVARWPAMDELLGRENEAPLYGMISGGIRDQTPTAFIYAINARDLTQWTYLSALVNLGLNHSPSRWSGDMGINWECASFMTLTSDVDGSVRHFIVVGGEGSETTHPDSTFTEHPQLQTKFPRAERSLQWMCGSLCAQTRPDGLLVPYMEYISGGKLDHGSMYGVNSFCDPKTGRQTTWGWITEEDLPQSLVDRQNWSGMLSIPRQLDLRCIQNVVGTLKSKLKEITSFEIEPDSDDSFTVRTLGVAPAQSVERLRAGTKFMEIKHTQTLDTTGKIHLDVQTCRFELVASFSVSDDCSTIGLSIHHDEELSLESSTRVYLEPSSENILVERPDSSHIDASILTFTEKAPFTLLSRRGQNGQLEREQLQIRAFFDESVLEIFVNDRCTFATRIYPNSKRCWGIRFWADDPSAQSHLLMAKAWDGLRAELRVAG